MNHQVYDIDGDSQVQIREMTESQISFFRFREKKTPKSEKKQKLSKKKSEEKSKKQKITIRSSSSESSSEKKKPKKAVKTPKNKRKKEEFPVQTTQSRWGRQVKEEQLARFGCTKLIRCGRSSPTAKFSVKAKQTLKTGVTWWISHEDYVQHNWKTIFLDMYEMTARDLRIINSLYSNVIKDIHHIRMDNLEILYLFENNIKSIELLSRMRLPVLKDLSLRDNLITIIEPMTKMGLQNLQTLALSGNYILDLGCLYYLNSISLQNIYLDWKQSSVVVEDISWLAKMKTHPNKIGVMDNIILQSKERIPQRKVDDMIAQKFRKPPHHLIKRKIT